MYPGYGDAELLSKPRWAMSPLLNHQQHYQHSYYLHSYLQSQHHQTAAAAAAAAAMMAVSQQPPL